jgi:uncharacterized membrane protein
MVAGKSGAGSMVAGGIAKGAKGLAVLAGKRLLSSATDKIGGTTQRLTDYVEGGGGPGVMAALTGRARKGGDGKGKSLKVTNIVEHIDVGVPIRLAYDQWTQFADFPSFMKKVESVEQEDDQKLNWRAQILWSHRSWESTIIEQVPDKRIVWNSDGPKGTVDGAVTFHELAPELTRICVVLQYHPKGFFEHTGNIWRAQGRRARLEIKHFARHVMTEAVLHPEDIQGWRGEIHDGEVTLPDEEAREREEQDSEQAAEEPRTQPSQDDEADEAEEEQRRQKDDLAARRAERPRDTNRRAAGGADASTRRPGRGRDRDEPRAARSGRE